MSNEKKMRSTYKVYFRSIQISDGWKKDVKDIFIRTAYTYTADQAIGYIKTLESKKPDGYREYQGGNELCYVRNYFIAVEQPKPQPVKKKEVIYQMTFKDYGI